MKKSILFILIIAAFSTTFGLTIISPFLPVFAKAHGANGFWLGMIFAGFGLSRGIIMPIIGKASDKRGRKIFVTSGLLLYTAISLFYSASENIYQLAIVRLIHGFATGMVMPVVLAYVGDYAEKGKEGITIGTINMVFYIGLAAGPLLGGFLYHKFGFQSVFNVMAGLGGFAFFLVLFFMPSDKKAPMKPLEKTTPFHSLIRYTFIKAILIIVMVITLILVVFLSFLPSLANKLNINAFHVGIIISTGIFLAGILQIPFGWLSDKFDPPGKLLQIGIGTCISMLALLVMPLCPNYYALLSAGLFIGLGAGISMPPLTALAIDIGHVAGMGSWMGIFSAARSLSFAIAPVICGVIMDYFGINSVFYILTLLAFFGTLGFLHYAIKRLKGIKI